MQTARGGEWVMRWKVEFPFLLPTLQTTTQILLLRVKKSAKASRNWINIDRRSDRKIEWRLGLGLQPGYEPFALIMNVFRDQSYHEEVVAYIFQRLLQTNLSNILLMTICTYTRNMNWTHVQSLFNSSEGWSIFNSLVDIMYQVKLPLLIIVTFTATWRDSWWHRDIFMSQSSLCW